MTIKLGVVMDPIADINYKKDTTLAMLWAAQARDWQLFYMEQTDLYLEQGVARARMARLTVFHDPQSWFKLDKPEEHDLAELDVMLMRKDPPFDNEYIYSTYILEEAERKGTLVVNRCQSLRDCNEKVFATQFPQCCPPVLVSADMQRLKDFQRQHGDVIFKPLDGMGGTAIFRVKPDDPNVSVILEMLTGHGRQTIMAQKFIPQISDGDKRILMINVENRYPIAWPGFRWWAKPAATWPRAGAGGPSRSPSGIAGSPPRWAQSAREGPVICRPRCDRRLPHRNQRHQPHLYPGN